MRTLSPIIGAVLLLMAARAHGADPEAVLHFELQKQLPVMKVQVDGLDATLILDLGGAAALALRPGWPGSTTVDSDGARVLNFADGSSIQVPAVAWRKSPVPPGIDGYLGYGYLRRYSLVIDYSRRAVRLFRQGVQLDECRAAPVALLQLGSLPYVQFERAGKPFLLGLDTGANQNVVKRGNQDEASRQPTMQGDIRLAGQAISTGPFRAIDLPIPVLDGLLGYDFFARYRVCLDSTSKTFSAEPFSTAR